MVLLALKTKSENTDVVPNHIKSHEFRTETNNEPHDILILLQKQPKK